MVGRTRAVGGKEMESYSWKISVNVFIALRCQGRAVRGLE